MSRARLLQPGLGVAVAASSLPTLLAAKPALVVLASGELLFALLYCWPRLRRAAGAGLLAVMAVALLAHALGREFAATPFFIALAVLALWPPRAVRGQSPEDAAALRIFLLRSPGDFSHLAHVRAARAYVQELPLGQALERFEVELRAFTRAKGAAAKYHQTITVAFLLLLRSRLAGAPQAETFEAFLARNPELASSRCLELFYQGPTLASARARADFVFPDRFQGADLSASGCVPPAASVSST